MRSESMRKLGSLPSSPIASKRWARARTASALSNDNAAEVSGFTKDTVAFSIFLERATDGIQQVLRLRRFGRVVTRGFLRCDLHMRVGGHEVVGDRHALDDL